MNPRLTASIERSSILSAVRNHRAELALSLRVTVAAVASFLVSRAFHVPLPLWTVLTAVILTQATFGSSLKATIDYLASTFCGSVYAGVISVLIPHESQMAQAGVLALAVAPLALLAGLWPSFSAATFTGVLVLLVPEIAHVGPIASAVYRVVEVAVGASAALVVSLVLFPTRAHSLLVDAAGRMLDLMAQALPRLAAALIEGRDPAAVRGIQDGIGEALARLELLAVQAGHERIGPLAPAHDPGPLVRTLLRLRHDLVILGRAAAGPLPEALSKTFRSRLEQTTAIVADGMHDMARALGARRVPLPFAALERSLEEFADACVAVRQDGLMLSLPIEAVERIFALGFALDQLRQHLRDLDRCVREAARMR
jgi:uncharacterized membrane protein YccC